MRWQDVLQQFHQEEPSSVEKKHTDYSNKYGLITASLTTNKHENIYVMFSYHTRRGISQITSQ